MGGDGGGGDGGFAANQKAEEDRKAGLRTKINQIYGIDNPSSAAAPTREQFTTGTTGLPDVMGGEDGSVVISRGGQPVFDQAGFDKATADWNAAGQTDPMAKAARDAESKAEGTLSDATRAFYGDQLQHDTEKAFRNNRFALADRGTLGGSAQIDTERELSRDNTLGATRIADQVAGAVAGLKNSNESERLNAMNLVNQGSGQDAVAGAQAGLQRSLSNAQSQQKANITSDLFAGGADSIAAANNGMFGGMGMYNPMMMAKLGTFFNPGAGGATRTPTG